MDAFYASVEQRDFSKYRGKPLAVGGSSHRGVVAAASYEAREYGVKSAMPSVTARRKCPGLIFAKPRFDVYKAISLQIRQIFHEYTDLIEPLSLDEAFLDVTHNKKHLPSATLIAKEIREKIYCETRLTASAGISINKFLAKVASDIKKPDGMFIILPDRAQKFVEELPVDKFFGVGKVTAAKMHKFGIYTGADLKKLTQVQLNHLFGKAGLHYYRICRGIDDRPVNPDRIRKSVGAENTFDYDLTDLSDLQKRLDDITDTLVDRIFRAEFRGRTLTLKVKYSDFKQITRGKSMNKPIADKETIREMGYLLLQQIDVREGIRLLGLTVSNFDDTYGYQLTIDF